MGSDVVLELLTMDPRRFDTRGEDTIGGHPDRT